MIIKIGSLLAVGFGEAGTDLIARNIENNGSLNVMIPGKKIMAIYGFCDIRNFTDATEVLEAQVMVFVNEIAEICHEVVNQSGGYPNKNIGDAFLLVWKFRECDTTMIQNSNETLLTFSDPINLCVKQTADIAIFSFVKMIAEIAKSNTLQKYRTNPGLKERIPNYNGVKMGFGLHVGWSIEGPIGSEFKIDASYLGSHVNMSSRLEGATKQYGVPILISEDVYRITTLRMREQMRQIDCVMVKENEKSMDLFTVDVSTDNLIKKIGVSKPADKTPYQKKKAKVLANLDRDKLLAQIAEKRMTMEKWRSDKDIMAMREPFGDYFLNIWKDGFAEFKRGNWASARHSFIRTKVFISQFLGTWCRKF